ncbi:MAG TPA: cob(I)yrinic acid a,c-diamide adenosyltransferase [Firmicutes bacterium]|nr:MAG: cob(I)yrinic acid a,c-diamide adenosyltransferase [Candidatus Coatesbacteria bacterium]RLC45080.1 MAG: cob(I)yrinic acid a,c-diamide adenosyltransferase [Candidatus Coatesbacteria bacterium]HDM42927.1 cob(I)yrinic acid a,c-diamide adenosyltransferase [Bacillota bacterium]
MKKGILLVFTGEGKGKTTASLGVSIRAIGYGLSTLILQFIKRGDTGEVLFSRKYGEPLIVPLGMGQFIDKKSSNPIETINCSLSLSLARALISSELFDVIVLDEVGVAVSLGLLDVKALLDMVNSRPKGVTIIITGRNTPESIIKNADIVSDIGDLKHHFKSGIKAIEGIDF